MPAFFMCNELAQEEKPYKNRDDGDKEDDGNKGERPLAMPCALRREYGL